MRLKKTLKNNLPAEGPRLEDLLANNPGIVVVMGQNEPPHPTSGSKGEIEMERHEKKPVAAGKR